MNSPTLSHWPLARALTSQNDAIAFRVSAEDAPGRYDISMGELAIDRWLEALGWAWEEVIAQARRQHANPNIVDRLRSVIYAWDMKEGKVIQVSSSVAYAPLSKSAKTKEERIHRAIRRDLNTVWCVDMGLAAMGERWDRELKIEPCMFKVSMGTEKGPLAALISDEHRARSVSCLLDEAVAGAKSSGRGHPRL